MKTFRDFNKYWDELNESTLSRVWQMANDKDRVFALLTAHRGTLTDAENKSRNAKLKNEIRKQGYGFFSVDGYWVENEGTPEEMKVKEESFFVSIPVGEDEDKFREFVVRSLKKYDQDAAVIKLGDNNVSLIDKAGKVFAQIGKFNVNKVASMYSKLQSGKTFVFESAQHTKQYVHKLIEREYNKKE